MRSLAAFENKNNFSETFWDLNQGKMLQALACIGVMIHHVTQELSGFGELYIGPVTIFSSMGILFTSIFFFFSGYGLITSVLNKPTYLDNFIGHRIPVILVPFFVSNIIGVSIRLFLNRIPTTKGHILECFLGYRLINGNGWYIIEIFFLYLIFYLIFKIIKNKDIALILLCISTIFIIGIGFHNGHDMNNVGSHWFMGEWWYNSTAIFIMGLLFARFKDTISNFAKRHYFIKLIITIILFVFVFAIEEKIRITYGYYQESVTIDGINSKLITYIAQTILCVIWMLMVLLFNLKFSLNSKVLKFISIFSLETFLIHGYFLNDIFSANHPNKLLLYISVIVCGLAAGAIMHVLDSLIIYLISNKDEKSSKEVPSIHLALDFVKGRCQKLYFENKKRFIAFLSIFIVLVISLLALINSAHSSATYKKELSMLSSAEIGNIVTFGRYNTNGFKPGKEPLEWIVLKKDGNRLLLVTKEGITGSTYYNKHSKISWKESDLCYYLNNELYDDMFSKKEMMSIIPNPDTADALSLLSVEEATSLFSDNKSRELAISDVAKRNGTNINQLSKANSWDMKGYRSSWWWLRGTEDKKITAPIVSVDGEILTDEKYVNKPNGAVRPVIWVEY